MAEETNVTTTTNTEVAEPKVETPEVNNPATEEEKALELGKGTEIIRNGEKVPNDKEGDKQEKEEDKEDKPKEDKDSPQAVEQDVKDQLKAQEDAKSDLATKGVDYDALAKEYEENGSLSAESMKKLEDAGYPKSLVQSFIKGFEATVQQYTNTVYKMAGGEKEYGRMCQFISSLGQNEVDAFNSAIEAGNLTQLGVMMEGYKARMTAKYGTSNRSILGGGQAQTQGGFTSKEAMVKAMNDPKYGRDMAYTEKVQKMTMQSNFIG